MPCPAARLWSRAAAAAVEAVDRRAAPMPCGPVAAWRSPGASSALRASHAAAGDAGVGIEDDAVRSIGVRRRRERCVEARRGGKSTHRSTGRRPEDMPCRGRWPRPRSEPGQRRRASRGFGRCGRSAQHREPDCIRWGGPKQVAESSRSRWGHPQGGHPRHPLYVPYSAEKVTFKICRDGAR
jgi:hypothetical protein